MDAARQHDPEPLIKAVTANDYFSEDHPTVAIRAIQQCAQSNWGEQWNDERALKELRRLIDLKYIKVQGDRPATNLAEGKPAGPAIKSRYVQVPEDER